MKFEGAVLVENTKIREACRKYRVACDYWNENILPVVRQLNHEWEELSWWKRNFCTDRWDDKALTTLRWKYEVDILRNYWHIVYADGLHQAGLISEEVYNNMKDVECLLHYNNETVQKDLVQMVKCGEPVYLNVEQCRFVNRFYNLDVKGMENE